MKNFSELVEQYLNSFEVAKSLLEKSDIFLSVNEIYDYLVDSPEINEYENLIVKEIPGEQIASIVERQYRLSPPSQVIAEVELLESITPSNVPVFLVHQQVKIKGEIWVIHKNDVDPFPSNPHAHNYQNNLVVHLGNGMIYKKRKLVGKLEKKKLSLLRSEIKNIELPELSL